MMIGRLAIVLLIKVLCLSTVRCSEVLGISGFIDVHQITNLCMLEILA